MTPLTYDETYEAIRALLPHIFFALEVRRTSSAAKATWCATYEITTSLRAPTGAALVAKLEAEIAEAALPGVPVGTVSP